MLTIEFGSSKRGDLDATSDRDVLLIGDNWRDLIEEKELHTKKGHSVTCFTRDRVSYLVSTGNLFFKHIKDEGVLVSGSQEKYNRLMAAWSPATSYVDEIEQNLDILEVLSYTPRSQWGMLVAIDIIISSVRNILIRRLADLGMYIFSWESVMETAADLGQIRNIDIELYLLSRRIKNLYRQGHSPDIREAFFEELSEAAMRVFKIGDFVSFNSRKSIRNLPERFPDGSYKQLRGLEILCAEYDFEPALAKYSQWVKEPSYFCSGSFKNLLHR